MQYKIKSLFIIRTKFKAGYMSPIRKHGRKVLTKGKNRRRINIQSHINNNHYDNLKSSNIDYVESRTVSFLPP